MKAEEISQDRGRSEGLGSSAPEATPRPLLDTSYLEAQVCGDPQLAQELLRLYAESLIELAPVVRGEPGRARCEAAHKLKGASLAVGAFALARLCEHLEKEVAAGAASLPSDLEVACPEPLHGEVALALEATQRRITELLEPGRA